MLSPKHETIPVILHVINMKLYLSYCMKLYLSYCMKLYLSYCMKLYLSYCMKLYLSYCMSADCCQSDVGAWNMTPKQVNVDHSHLTTTRNKKFLIPHSKTKHHMNSFFPQAIRLWNKLPTEIKDAPTVPAFASGLNKFYAFFIDILV